MYSKKIVAFIDLLGFKNTVLKKDFLEVEIVLSEFSRMVNRVDEQNTTSLSIAHFVQKENGQKLFAFDENKQNITYFSDCVVWSYPFDRIKIDFIHVLDSLLSALSKIQFVLLKKKILIRGGVTFGYIYQGDNKIFGPALIKAYQLEQLSQFPRIVLDIEFLKLFDNKLLKWIKNQITFTNKGFFYLDLFRYVKSVNDMCEKETENPSISIMKDVLKRYVDSLAETIIEGKKFNCPKIVEKYNWMERKYRFLGELTVPKIEI